MVNIPKFFKEGEANTPRLVLPLLPLRDIVVFPFMVAPLFVGRAKSVNALSEAMNKDKVVFLATQKKAGIDNPGEQDISEIGTIGKVLQLLRLPDGTVKALVEGKGRARVVRFLPEEEFFRVELERLVERELSPAESTALMRSVVEAFEEYAGHNRSISKELVSNITSITDPSQMADTVASHFSFKLEDKQRLLDSLELTERLPLLLSLIKMETEVFRMDQRIKTRIKEQMEKSQKQYYLNEQMRAIKKEMGSEDDLNDEIREIEEGKADRANNVLTNAPHTMQRVIADNWDRPYSRELAAFPSAATREHKSWPTVGRVDGAYGDRNLVCTCPPTEQYRG